ncbi:hypothetical protein BKA70DRAFT_1218349 [Coprinopsis sp. MPI-PUGE-AT-0042]|nr:hypothetical protein BKA70DRAFT_1218349 [Coprinopsis sp. MPI-PUGE-AT-0042]
MAFYVQETMLARTKTGRHDMSVILVTGSYDHNIRFWEAWTTRQSPGRCSRQAVAGHGHPPKRSTFRNRVPSNEPIPSASTIEMVMLISPNSKVSRVQESSGQYPRRVLAQRGETSGNWQRGRHDQDMSFNNPPKSKGTQSGPTWSHGLIDTGEEEPLTFSDTCVKSKNMRSPSTGYAISRSSVIVSSAQIIIHSIIEFQVSRRPTSPPARHAMMAWYHHRGAWKLYPGTTVEAFTVLGGGRQARRSSPGNGISLRYLIVIYQSAFTANTCNTCVRDPMSIPRMCEPNLGRKRQGSSHLQNLIFCHSASETPLEESLGEITRGERVTGWVGARSMGSTAGMPSELNLSEEPSMSSSDPREQVYTPPHFGLLLLLLLLDHPSLTPILNIAEA